MLLQAFQINKKYTPRNSVNHDVILHALSIGTKWRRGWRPQKTLRLVITLTVAPV